MQNNNNKRKVFWGLCVGSLLALVSYGVVAFTSATTAPIVEKEKRVHSMRHLLVLPPKELAPFEFKTQQGEVFTNQSLRGRWHFLTFGYSACPDTCPMTWATMKRVASQLEEAGIDDFRVAMISVDPERDKLGKLVPFDDVHFIGLIGTDQVTKGLAEQLGVAYSPVKTASQSSDEGYTVDHSGAVFLINPEGQVRALLRIPGSAEAIVADVIELYHAS